MRDLAILACNGQETAKLKIGLHGRRNDLWSMLGIRIRRILSSYSSKFIQLALSGSQ